MSKPARTVFIFGIYLFAVSLQLLLVPNLLLGLFSLPETHEVWIRVVGLLALLLGYYYVQCARQGLAAFFPLTVYARVAACAGFVFFVLMGWAAAPLILFGLVDLLGAGWTWMTLRGEQR